MILVLARDLLQKLWENVILVHFSGLEKSSNLDNSQLVGRFQLLKLCEKFHFTIVGGGGP